MEKVLLPDYSDTKFSQPLKRLRLSSALLVGERNIAVLSQNEHPTIPLWLQNILNQHTITHDVYQNKWCNRIARDLASDINNNRDLEALDDQWGYDAQVISGQYEIPSKKEGFAFHSMVLVTLSEWDMGKNDYIPSQYIAIDMTASVLKKNFDTQVIIVDAKEDMLLTLKNLYEVAFEID